MILGDLVNKLVDLPQDIECNIQGVEYNGRTVTFTLNRGATRSPQKNTQTAHDKKVSIVRTKILNGDFNFNFHEFAYALEVLSKDILGVTSPVNLLRDVQKIKKIFPNKKAFGKKEYDILYTFISIFNAVIKTPNYQIPTWGGIQYAMPAIMKNLKEDTATDIILEEEKF